MEAELALHAWVPGQLLTPDHFKRLEQVMLAHMAARFQLSGLPNHGLAALELDTDSLVGGIVSIRRLSWMRKDGMFLTTDGKGNLSDLDPLEVKAVRRTPIYLCVMRQDDPPRTVEGSDVVLCRYQARLMASDPPWPEDVAGRVEEHLKLLEIEPSKDGARYELGPHVPPLLLVGTTPFLREELLDVHECVEWANKELLESTRRSRATSNDTAHVQRRLAQGQRLLVLLRESGVARFDAPADCPRLHPYQLFCALRDYACELAIHAECEVDATQLEYVHADLRACYERVLGIIMAARPARPASPIGLEFQRDGRVFILRDLPEALCRAPRGVVLEIEGHVDTPEIVLSSPGRMARLHSSLLPGLRLSEVERQDPQPGDNKRRYRIACEGPEWEHVVRERALAFLRVPGAEIRATLLWKGAKRGTP